MLGPGLWQPQPSKWFVCRGPNPALLPYDPKALELPSQSYCVSGFIAVRKLRPGPHAMPIDPYVMIFLH